MRAAPLLLPLLGACARTAAPESPPLGLPMDEDGVVRAGAAIVDVTPEIIETFTDVNGDHLFDGCFDDPNAERCAEPFDDVNGNGWFDAVFIGGYGPLRPATSVHDPVSVRAAVIVKDGEYLAFVGMDFVGLGQPRIHAAAEALAAEGFAPERLLAGSSHNHQGQDTLGLWGMPYNLADPIPGFDPEYQERIEAAIADAVREAAAAVEPVDLRIGAVRMRDRGPWFNGPKFGGKNPDLRMHGMIHDGRDPVIISDQLLTIQGLRSGTSDAVFTLTNWSGHPEVRGSENNAISSDWVGPARVALEQRFGGVALHIPECLGGMQSALGGDIPRVLEDGTHVYAVDAQGQPVIDADGDAVPVWAERISWDFVTSHGWHIAEAAIDALEAGEPLNPSPMTVDWADLYVPVRNIAYQLLGPKGVFDRDFASVVTDPSLCPAVIDGTDVPGCLTSRTLRVRMGDVGFVTAPGELLPELAWGMPEDPVFDAESSDPTRRGPDSVYFPQHPRACDAVTFEECRSTTEVDGCDCLRLHAAPYRIAEDPTAVPLLDHLDTRYRAVLGATDDYLSYIIPEPDFHRTVSLLALDDGDHYEDTVSPAYDFATKLLDGQQAIDSP